MKAWSVMSPIFANEFENLIIRPCTSGTEDLHRLLIFFCHAGARMLFYYDAARECEVDGGGLGSEEGRRILPMLLSWSTDGESGQIQEQ